MSFIIGILDNALLMFEKYAATTTDTTDDSIAAVLRLVLNFVKAWAGGVTPTHADVDALASAMKSKVPV